MQAGSAAGSDTVRRRRLRRARRNATVLLVAVAVVFVATVLVGEPTASSTWLGFVQAGAEAALIGGLADWFAVVALFRHPLGLPIPHTAVIPQSKDGLGANLATFVADNFLDPDDLVVRLGQADLATRAGRWLSADDNAQHSAERVVDVVAGWAARQDPDAMAASIATGIDGVVDQLPVADLAGRAIGAATDGDHHHDLYTAVVQGVRRAVLDNEQVLRQRLYDESPAWVPEAIDDLVFDRALAGLLGLLSEVERDASHDIRRIIDERLAALAATLRDDPAADQVVRERLGALLSSPGVRDWLAGTWSEVARGLTQGQARTSTVATVARLLRDLAGRLEHDQQLRAQVDEWVAAVAPAIARESRHEIAGLVASTVDRWDADETSDRLELWLGRDLQFVRINGTVVGAIVGLALHTITLL